MSVVLKDFIEAEGLEPGDRLPPERDLAVKLGLPRTALRRMLASLEKEGRLIRHVGRGTFIAGSGVTSTALRRPPGSTGDTLRTYPAEVFEARLIMEPKIAALAALRATSQEIDEMQKSIDRGSAAETLVEFEKWDAVFHRIIVGAARNGLLASLYEGIHTVRAGNLWGKMKEQSLTPERMKAYIAKHQATLDAIKDRDSREAERNMYDHIVEARANILGPNT
ncbi:MULTISPECIES: FadR/GntR family transcriptional regulator [Sinorhizobium]|jgi:DNA-binding FadR family transcriptional regulator|uniref:GntR family transcriptional regulator n=2 Tax=Sinorhizobium TaxID=28105 RepID=A0A2S3YUV6_9HYPH|nr:MULTISPECIES: FCD domain-containing protein [Sinorhizobium]PDT39469.1 FadR family transcriptional regulator [Sinorhizobium sp. FG01]AUX77550.1 GntR family transcriptional regulator protein [Sinorhizobium fredii]PDT54025.1 FadR family transcriptional regulator [Sinorhizobium sp. NG07B]POH31083.1 GntR family transcriptional regulator [Sinorhizobium americanum]POH35397.1 GntR family transcriptional regulator [Sinorhizobium americanum]